MITLASNMVMVWLNISEGLKKKRKKKKKKGVEVEEKVVPRGIKERSKQEKQKLSSATAEAGRS